MIQNSRSRESRIIHKSYNYRFYPKKIVFIILKPNEKTIPRNRVQMEKRERCRTKVLIFEFRAIISPLPLSSVSLRFSLMHRDYQIPIPLCGIGELSWQPHSETLFRFIITGIYYYEAERGRRVKHCAHTDNNRFARNIRIDLDVDLPDNNSQNVRHRRHGSLSLPLWIPSLCNTRRIYIYIYTHGAFQDCCRCCIMNRELGCLFSFFIVIHLRACVSEEHRVQFMARTHKRNAIFDEVMRNVMSGQNCRIDQSFIS